MRAGDARSRPPPPARGRARRRCRNRHRGRGSRRRPRDWRGSSPASPRGSARAGCAGWPAGRSTSIGTELERQHFARQRPAGDDETRRGVRRRRPLGAHVADCRWQRCSVPESPPVERSTAPCRRRSALPRRNCAPCGDPAPPRALQSRDAPLRPARPSLARRAGKTARCALGRSRSRPPRLRRALPARHQRLGGLDRDRGVAAIGVGADRLGEASFSGAPPTSTI